MVKDALVQVSVIVPCRNEAAYIETCLRTILDQEVGNFNFEIIVADGMSEDGTREILKKLAGKFARLRVVDNPKRTVSAGLNAAIRSAHGRIIVRMDAHTEYAADYLKQCVSVLEETGADNVGGPWIARGNGYLRRAIAVAFQSPFAMGGARGHDPYYEGAVDTVYLGCWNRGIFDRVGFFDEELVRNQDDEFNLRLTRSGARVWQSPKIRSWYCPRRSLKDLFLQYQQYGYWKVRVIQKHRLPASIRHLIPAAFATSLIALTVAAPVGKLPAYALAGLVGSYLVAALAAAMMDALQNGLELLPLLPVVYFCYHFAYGIGFLRGICDFLVLGRASTFAFKLTRPSKPPRAADAGPSSGAPDSAQSPQY